MFAIDPERFAAGRENCSAETAADDRLGERGRRIDDMLAIVEDKQDILVGQPLYQRVLVRQPARLRRLQPASEFTRVPAWRARLLRHAHLPDPGRQTSCL